MRVRLKLVPPETSNAQGETSSEHDADQLLETNNGAKRADQIAIGDLVLVDRFLGYQRVIEGPEIVEG